MSKVRKVRCDGCDAQTEDGLYPTGWKRLHVWSRNEDDLFMSQARSLDVCSPACAMKALEDTG